MGLFDNLKRNSKPSTTRRSAGQTASAGNSSATYDEALESARVTEREVQHFNGTEAPAVHIDAHSPSAAPTAASSASPEVPANDAMPLPEENAGPTKATFVPFREKGPVSHIVGQTKILGIINQKGGVGKSTTAVNLAAALGAAGKEVLLVDLDPQGNATSGYGIDKRDIDQSVYNVLLEDPIEDAILAEVGKGVDVLPSTISLAGAEVELVNEMARENRLKNALGSLRGRYDYILIDCPPSLGLLTINALVASDKLLIPIQCEFYALEGVTKLLDSMNRVKKALNPTLDIYGIVLTMYDGRTNLSKQVADEVRSFFGKTVFKTVIPRTVKLSEAPSYGQPILDYAPESKGAETYSKLAQEVIKRG